MSEYQKQWWNEAKNLLVFQNTICKKQFWFFFFFFNYTSVDIMQAVYSIMTKIFGAWGGGGFCFLKFFLCCCLIRNWSLFPFVLIVCYEFRGFMLVYLANFHFILPCHAGNGLQIRHCKGYAFRIVLLKTGLSPEAHICSLMLLCDYNCLS